MVVQVIKHKPQLQNNYNGKLMNGAHENFRWNDDTAIFKTVLSTLGSSFIGLHNYFSIIFTLSKL